MYNDELYHHGILGQKWGVRRFQNPDGSYTPAGQKRYGTGQYTTKKQYQSRLNDVDTAIARNKRDYYDAADLKKTIENKQTKLQAKGKDLNDKQKAKVKELEGKIKESTKNIKAGEKEVKALINKAKKDGYAVTSSATMRSVAKGSDYAAMALGYLAAVPMAALTGFYIVQTGPHIEGTKYKVKQPKVER